MTDTLELARQQEENIIGALLKSPEKITLVREIVKPDNFYYQVLGQAYGCILDLHERGLAVDSVTLGDEIERKGIDFSLGGKSGRVAISDLRTNFRGDNPESYAAKILDYSAKRALIQEFSTGATWANNGRHSSDIRDDMIRRLTDIKVPNAKLDKHTQTFKEALSQSWDEVNNGSAKFVPTGFYDLDKLLDGGLYAPDFMIIAGRPGKGKTSLLLSIAKHAGEKGKRVVMFSLEMANTQIIMRAISMETGIPFGAMRRGKMTKEQWEKYNAAVERFESLPIHLNDLPAITVNAMRQTLRKIEAVYGEIDLVIVDYLQLQTGDDDYGTREQEVSSVSRGLKAMAKEFGVPVLAAAQLSRAIEQRADKKPVLSDLRESGSLEQDADIVSFIHQDDEYSKTGKTEIITSKHRNGEVGSIDLIFRASMTKFENATGRIFNVNE